MADEFDQAWAAAPDEFDQAWSAAPSPDLTLESVSSQLGKGAAFGWFDEFQGAEGATRNAIADLFGRGNGLDWSTNYRNKVDQLRAMDAAVAEAHPKTAMALNLAGGILPALTTGGATAITGETLTAAPVVGRLMQDLFGVGIKQAPSIARLAEMGTVGGALASAGNATEGQRGNDALIGGGIGAIAGPVIGKALEGGVNLFGSLFSPYISRLSSSSGALAPEAGAINVKVGPSYTPEELFVAKQLKDTPIEAIRKGVNDFAEAADAPLFLPEAVNSASLTRSARDIANNKASMDFSQAAIASRTADAETRATALFDTISPVKDPYAGFGKISDAAKSIIDDTVAARTEATAPLYNEAYKIRPTIDDPAFNTFLEKDKILSRAVSKVKETFNNADLPSNSTPLLVQARKYIGNEIDSEIAKGNGQRARNLQETYDYLNSFLHNESTLALADETFSQHSVNLDALNETFLKKLSSVTDDKLKSVSQIMDRPPAAIEKLRGVFAENDALPEWEAGIRAYLQNQVENSRGGVNFADKLIGTTAQKDKLQAALGDSYESIIKGLSYEDRMFRGKNLYNAGSSTFGNIAEADARKEAMGIIGKLRSKDWAGAVAHIFNTGLDDETAQKVARIYFDSGTGKEALNKIVPLLESYAKTKTAAKAAGTVGGVSTGRVAQSAEESSRNRSLLTTGSLEDVQKSQSLPSRSTQDWLSQLQSKYSRSSSNSTTNPSGNLPMDLFSKKPVKAVESMIDSNPFDAAVYEMESGRNPKAKNPNSSAAGGFQLIKATQKALGVNDPYDLGENYAGFKKLTDENRARFGDDPRMLYAAHFLGAPTLAAWLNGDDLTPTQARHVKELKEIALPRFMKIYTKKTAKQVEA